MSSSSGWLSDTTANKIKHSYLNGFLDVSGSNITRGLLDVSGSSIIRGSNTIHGSNTIYQSGDYAWNAYGQVISGPYETTDVYFGGSVGSDVSGLTFVVGANHQEGANTTLNNDGAVTVYRYDTNAELWYQLGNTITGETNNDSFGQNVDMNDAGTRIMVTDHGADFVNVYDYNSSTNTWDKQVSITAHTVHLFAGRISGDGNTIVFSDYIDTSYTGKQYVYRNTSGTTWTKIGEFTGSHTNAVAAVGPTITYDGNRITFPERDYNYDVDGNSSADNGRVTIYDYSGSGTTWNQVGNPIYGTFAGAKLPASMDFSKDGSIVALGSNNNQYVKYVKVYQYDASIDGSWNQLGTTINGPTDNNYGTGVRLSDDGTVLLVNDVTDDTTGTDNGALYIYKYTNGDWVQQGSTIYGIYGGSGTYPGGYLGSSYGQGISMSGDGTKIFAGGNGADLNGIKSGHVQAWQWSKKTHTKPLLDANNQTMTIWGSAEHNINNYTVAQLGSTLTGNNDGLGYCVNMNYTGDIMVTVKPFTGSYNGSVYVYKYRNGIWGQVGSTLSGTASEYLGIPCLISNDGKTIALGSHKATDGNIGGSVHVYEFINGDWSLKGSIIDSNNTAIDEGFGSRGACLSGDGTVVVGYAGKSNYAKVFKYVADSTNDWVQMGSDFTIDPGSLNIADASRKTGLSDDGTIFAVSSPVDDTTGTDNGKVEVYKFTGEAGTGSWSQLGSTIYGINHSSGTSKEGATISLSADGTILATGSWYYNSSQGIIRVYKYIESIEEWAQMGTDILHNTAEEWARGYEMSADGKTLAVGVTNEDNPSGTDRGAVYIYKYMDGNWVFIKQVNSPYEVNSTYLGKYVTISGDGKRFAAGSNTNPGLVVAWEITNNPQLKIDSGNVGIGTTSPKTQLEVRVNDEYSGLAVSRGDVKMVLGMEATTTNAGTIQVFSGVDAATPTSSSSTYNLLLNPNGGNVGIGTSSPTKPLDVHGDVMITGTTTSNDSVHYPLYIRTYSTSGAQVQEGIGTGIQFGVERTDTDNITTTGWIRSYGANNIPGSDDQWNMGFRVRSNDIIVEPMTLTYDGRVGIGKTNPTTQLDVNGNISFDFTLQTKGYVFIHNTKAASDDPDIYADIRVIRNTLRSDGMYIGYGNAGTTGGHLRFYANNTSKRMEISANTGDVYIINDLHIRRSTAEKTIDLNGTLRVRNTTSNSQYWDIYTEGHTGNLGFKVWHRGNLNSGYLKQSSQPYELDFTGQHRSFIENIPLKDVIEYAGLIVCANKDDYIDIDGTAKRGKDAIQISQSLPLVSLCEKEKDKSCFGVISDSEDPDKREYSQGAFVSIMDKQYGDSRFLINSLGEGAIWVSNKTGSLESGDYITTSSISGYGQKQNDDILHNYTVAKITMNCDFNPQLKYKKQVKRTIIDFFQDVSGDYWEDESGNFYYNPGANYFEDSSGVRIFYDGEGKINYDIQLLNEDQGVIQRYDICGNKVQYTNNYYHNITKELLCGYRINKKEDDSIKKMYSNGLWKNPKYHLKLDSYNNLISVEQNILDDNGEIQWEDSTEQEYPYEIRHIDSSGNILTEEEYNTKIAASEEVYIAAFVGCTYHCG